VDDDCNTLADDDDTGLDASTTSTWYADTDSDGEGDPNVSAQACGAPSGYVANADDCDDTDGTNANCACPEIPANVTTAVAGPHEQHGYCWYLTEDGVTCDVICSNVGGSNLANDVEAAFPSNSSEWPDTCGTPNAAEVVSWFYNNGNAGGWTNDPSGTSHHTFGYGYRGQQHYGKCMGSHEQGTFPNTNNSSSTRSLTCPCFTLQ
jgi:hypothetical protein